MGTDLDRMLSASLQATADAGSPIDPQPLLHSAVAQGRRVRTRRRVAVTVIAAVVVTGVAANSALSPGQYAASPDQSPRPSSSSSQPLDVDLTLLPDAAGQPGAATRPDLVGSDTGLLHFSVDLLSASARRVAWASGPGVEWVDVQRSDFQVYLGLARTRATLPVAAIGFSNTPRIKMSAPSTVTLGGRPATLRTSGAWNDDGRQGRVYSFVWQPVDGLWARYEVQTTSLELAQQIYQQIQLDRARRCVVPIRVGYLPAGARVQKCEVTLAQGSPGRFMDGTVTVGAGQRQMWIRGVPSIPGAGEYPRPLKAGSYHVYADPDGISWTMQEQGLFFDAMSERPAKVFPLAEVLKILGGITIAPRLDQPSTW